MEHFTFLIWMLLYFPCKQLADYLGYLAWGEKRRNFSENVEGITALTHVVIYFYVGYLLY